jgi:prepilin-type N-terminal cleavage/methylation domain-containing protein
MRKRFLSRGFTLIELLIVIAIILILIAIALPNFLEAQVRAKVARTLADMRSTGTAIEAFRTERGVLLIDFWDDGTPQAGQRWREKLGMIGKNPQFAYNYFEECLYPLTSPAAYMTQIPIDPWSDPSRQVGLSANETGNTYLYFDNDNLVKDTEDFGIDVYHYNDLRGRWAGVKPLSEEEFALLSVGPDRELGRSLSGQDGFRGLPYSPTNGTNSVGELAFRSGGFTGP